MIFVPLVGVALSAFCAGFLIGRAERLARHAHDWSKWRQAGGKWKGDYTVTLNVRECATCGLTEAQPIS